MARVFVAAIAILIGLSGATQAQTSAYPNRTIRILHGWAAGGNVDLIARLLASEMQKGLGQPVIVEPKVGQAGALAAEAIARTEPDGYTLLVLPSAHAAHGALSRSVRYNVVDDFEWISTASFYPFLISVRKDSRFQTLKQLIDEARARPGALTYGSAGIGSILHTTVELMGIETNTRFLHVPYRGEAPALTGLMTGDFDFIAATTGPITPRVNNGDVRALAVTSKTRWKDLPNVPSTNEAGVPGFEVESWTGLAAPAGVPRPVVDLLNAELRRVLSLPDVREKLALMGGEARASTPEAMKALVVRQLATWTKLGREANISID